MRRAAQDNSASTWTEEELRHSEKMQDISRVANSAAHDLNNILLAIDGYAESLLRQPSLTVAMRQEVEDILTAVQKAHRLSGQLLAVEDRPAEPLPPLNLDTLLRSMERTMRALLPDNIRLSLESRLRGARVPADQMEIERIILNLVINARDAMPDGGSLVLSTAEARPEEAAAAGLDPGLHVRLTVRDTGQGMTEEVRKNLFEPFFSTKGKKGTGLGLYSVYGIVRKYRGHVAVRSAPGQGTAFQILLPAIAVDFVGPAQETPHPYLGKIEQLSARPSDPQESSAESEQSTDFPGKTHFPQANMAPTILVVEDEQLVRPVYRRMLEAVGFRVLEAGDGGAAVQLCEQHPEPIHLLVTDVMMPRIDGFELARRLKKQRPQLKVLFVTGFMDVREMTRQQGISADNLLQKPFMPDALIRKVQALLAVQ